MSESNHNPGDADFQIPVDLDHIPMKLIEPVDVTVGDENGDPEHISWKEYQERRRSQGEEQ